MIEESGLFIENMNRRRVILKIGASALASVLSACGGGGGGENDTAAQEKKLQEVFYQLKAGMVWTDVEALVGFEANKNRQQDDLIWKIGNTQLQAVFTSTEPWYLISAYLTIGGDLPISRNFGDEY